MRSTKSRDRCHYSYYVHLIDSEPLAGGINGVWRVQQATKRANSQPCAVFVFDKKQAARFNPLARPDGLVRDIEQLSRSLKTEVQVITRMRHPSILQIVEALTESPGVLAFASEPY